MIVLAFGQEISGYFSANIVVGVIDPEGSGRVDKLCRSKGFLLNRMAPLTLKVIVIFEVSKRMLALDEEKVHLRTR